MHSIESRAEFECLVFDVAGALVIILPDIPQVHKRLPPGRKRKALQQLETGELASDAIGFDELATELESLTGNPIPSGTERLVVSVFQFSIGGTGKGGIRTIVPLLEGEIDRDREDWSEMDTWEDTDLGELRYPIERGIRRDEARIRAFGFGVLAIGFAFQIVGNLF